VSFENKWAMSMCQFLILTELQFSDSSADRTNSKCFWSLKKLAFLIISKLSVRIKFSKFFASCFGSFCFCFCSCSWSTLALAFFSFF